MIKVLEFDSMEELNSFFQSAPDNNSIQGIDITDKVRIVVASPEIHYIQEIELLWVWWKDGAKQSYKANAWAVGENILYVYAQDAPPLLLPLVSIRQFTVGVWS